MGPVKEECSLLDGRIKNLDNAEHKQDLVREGLKYRKPLFAVSSPQLVPNEDMARRRQWIQPRGTAWQQIPSEPAPSNDLSLVTA